MYSMYGNSMYSMYSSHRHHMQPRACRTCNGYSLVNAASTSYAKCSTCEPLSKDPIYNIDSIYNMRNRWSTNGIQTIYNIVPR